MGEREREREKGKKKKKEKKRERERLTERLTERQQTESYKGRKREQSMTKARSRRLFLRLGCLTHATHLCLGIHHEYNVRDSES